MPLMHNLPSSSETSENIDGPSNNEDEADVGVITTMQPEDANASPPVVSSNLFSQVNSSGCESDDSSLQYELLPQSDPEIQSCVGNGGTTARSEFLGVHSNGTQSSRSPAHDADAETGSCSQGEPRLLTTSVESNSIPSEANSGTASHERLSNDFPLGNEQVECIKQVMAGIQLPEANKPPWAKEISDTDWEQLVNDRIKTKNET